jgi:stage II sporulation protein D
MRDRRWSRLTAATVAAVLAVAAPAAAQEAPDGPVDLGAYAGSVRFEGGASGILEVIEERRYADTLELRVHPGGHVLVNELGIEAYVEGLAEVPASWPEEALKAQAVAARTYAWYQTRLGTFDRRGLGYDICATVACQVFHGRDVVETPGVGQRWADAVAATAGEVLTFDDRPILARFFSTSGGRTQPNEEVFPGEGPRPYLKGVEDPYDAASPLHRWQVRFSRDELDAILSRGEELGATVPFDDLHVRPVAGGEDRVVVTGRDGTRRDVGVSAFRFFVSDVAPELFPDRFPGPREDGGRLPATLPSSRFELTVTEDEVVVDGRGWGHGVGMSQYGALGQAQAGIGYGDILGHYYEGIRPSPDDGLPQRLRVGLDESVDEPVTVRADGPFRVVAGGREITDRALGTWRLVPRGDGTVGLVAPAGYGAPLVVAPTGTSRVRPLTVEQVRLETVVNKPSELTLEVTTGEGRPVLSRPLGIVEAGRHAAGWSLDDESGGPLPPGEYRARLVATDEEAASAGEPVTLTVVAPSIPATAAPSLLPAPDPLPATSPPLLLLGVAGLLGLAAGAGAGSFAGRGR